MKPFPELYAIGSVAGKHGFKGAIQIKFLEHKFNTILKKGTFLFLLIEGKGVPFLIEQILHEGCYALEDINNEQTAQELMGLTVLVETQRVKKTKKALDIIGFQLLDPNKKQIGIVQKTEYYPAGEMLFVKLPDETECMLPLVEEWILDVDFKKKHIILQLPEGLLEINDPSADNIPDDLDA